MFSGFMKNLNTRMIDHIHLFLLILVQYPEEGAHKLFTHQTILNSRVNAVFSEHWQTQ